MNSDYAVAIAELSISLLREILDNDEPDDRRIEDTLIEIAQITDRGLKEHSGESLDPSLIHPESLID